MTALATRTVGRTDVAVTSLGFGAGQLGVIRGLPVSGQQARGTVAAAWEAGVRYFDTSPYYGHGRSEHRLGSFLQDKQRREYVVSTKVGRVFAAAPDGVESTLWPDPLEFDFRFDYSYDGIMRSHEQSLHRMGISRIDLLLVHDVDELEGARRDLALRQLFSSGAKALAELRAGGTVGGIGAGLNTTGMMPRLLAEIDLDCYVLAMPYTLLDQEALEGDFPLCEERGIGVVIGAPFASGILATGATNGARYRYEPATPAVREKTSRIEAVCQRHDVPLRAAALQFPLRHPVVSAVIPGPSTPAQALDNADVAQWPIPEELWTELRDEGLVRADAP